MLRQLSPTIQGISSIGNVNLYVSAQQSSFRPIRPILGYLFSGRVCHQGFNIAGYFSKKNSSVGHNPRATDFDFDPIWYSCNEKNSKDGKNKKENIRKARKSNMYFGSKPRIVYNGKDDFHANFCRRLATIRTRNSMFVLSLRQATSPAPGRGKSF